MNTHTYIICLYIYLSFSTETRVFYWFLRQASGNIDDDAGTWFVSGCRFHFTYNNHSLLFDNVQKTKLFIKDSLGWEFKESQDVNVLNIKSFMNLEPKTKL